VGPTGWAKASGRTMGGTEPVRSPQTHPRDQGPFDRHNEDARREAPNGSPKGPVGGGVLVEPETFATQTTAVAVATDGEWIRRRVGSPEAIRKLASKIATPAYDVQIVGYPQRMRDWNARNKRDRSLE